jgi:hypothetical protein
VNSIKEYSLEKFQNEVWCIWDEMFRMVINRIYREHSILANVRMTMFLLVKSVDHRCYKTGTTRREQRLQEFRFLKFAEEPKGHSTDVLV